MLQARFLLFIQNRQQYLCEKNRPAMSYVDSWNIELIKVTFFCTCAHFPQKYSVSPTRWRTHLLFTIVSITRFSPVLRYINSSCPEKSLAYSHNIMHAYYSNTLMYLFTFGWYDNNIIIMYACPDHVLWHVHCRYKHDKQSPLKCAHNDNN